MWLGSGPCPRVCLLVAVLAVPKLQALVYDFLPSTTAVFSYAIGSRKLSANEQFFVGAQTIWVVSLLQTTQIKQGVSFMAANKIYTSTNETTIVWIETELFFFSFFFFTRGGCVSCLRACFGARFFFFYVALRPRKRGSLLGTGTGRGWVGWGGGGGGTKEWRLDLGHRPKETGETVDRRQNNGSVKAVSPRHCPATCALRNCSFNCCVWEVTKTKSVALLLRARFGLVLLKVHRGELAY